MDLLGEKNFSWNEEYECAFNKIKSIMSTDALLHYRDYQLGATIGRNDDEGILRLEANFSKKLKKAQKSYPTGEKEFLSIFETLRTSIGLVTTGS